MTLGSGRVPGLGRDEVRDDPHWVPGFFCDLGSNNITAIDGLISACYVAPFLLCHAHFSEGRELFFRELVYRPTPLSCPQTWVLPEMWNVYRILLWVCGLSLEGHQPAPALKVEDSLSPARLYDRSSLDSSVRLCFRLAPDSSRLRSSDGQGTAYVAVLRQDGVSLSIIYLKKNSWSLNSAGELGLFRHTVILFF